MTNLERLVVVTRAMHEPLCDMQMEFLPSETKTIHLYGFNGREAVIPFLLNAFSIGAEFDWLLLLDEDAFLFPGSALYSSIDIMQRDGYACAGMLDGGVFKGRAESPLVLNSFFCLFNMRVLGRFCVKAALEQGEFSVDMIDPLQIAGLLLPFRFCTRRHGHYYEPYYRLFYALRKDGHKFLTLSVGSCPIDPEAVILNAPTGENLVVHAWYGREFRERQSRFEHLRDWVRAQR